MITKPLALVVATGLMAMVHGGAQAQERLETVFSCPDGVSLRATFTGEAGQPAEVTVSGSLAEKPAASGMWYEGAMGTLRGKGDTVDWTGAPLEGCVAVPGGADLVGPRWELVSFQSSDDAIGTTTAEDPARHSLSFRADGTVSVVLDCNVGHGEWAATPAGETGGSLELTKLASTRAFCTGDPFPDLAQHLGFVRTYTLKDGRLHLALEADGGIYSWRPAL